MDTKYGWRNVVQAIMTLVGTVVFAYSFAGDYFDLPNFGEEYKIYGIVFAILVFLSAILWHFMDLQAALGDRIPKIDIRKFPILDDVQMDMNITEQKGVFHITGISHMAHISFANNPKNRTDKNSPDNVRAEITFLDINRNPLFTIDGRWSHTDQPSEIRRGQSTTIESTNFPNNGAPRTLDLLIKYPEDEYCYGYNNASYGAPYYLHPFYEIKEKMFLIQILLKGAYIPNSCMWEFEINTKGKGDLFSIKYRNKWMKTRRSEAQKILSKKKLQVKKTKLSRKR